MKKNISTNSMNKNDLNKLSKNELIELVLSLKANQTNFKHKGARENAQNHEKNTISSNSMTLKQLSKYLPDAKKLGYTWNQLMKKSTRAIIMSEIKRSKNIESVHAIIPKELRDSQKYLELDRKLKQKEKLIKRKNEMITRRSSDGKKQQTAKFSNEFNFDDSIFDTTSNDQPLFKITEIGNTVNKKFNAFTNAFKINVRKNFIGDKNDVFSVFEKMVEMTIKKKTIKR